MNEQPQRNKGEKQSDQKFIFGIETINALNEVGSVLRKIHNRLISEGYVITNQKCIARHEQTTNKTIR